MVNIGVFLSDCSGEISEILDFEALAEFVQNIPGVAVVHRNAEFWRGDGLQIILDSIKNGESERIVVADSPPKLSEVKIAETVEHANLNPYLVEIINLKEHCAYPHRATPIEATEKAKAMLLSAIERVKLSEPLQKIEFPVEKSVLVIGGGIAGMQVAEDLTDLGFEVDLIEKTSFIGGLAAQAGRFFPTDDCAICIQSPTSDLKTITKTSRKCVYRSGFAAIPNLNIHTDSELQNVEGVPGNFKATILKKARYVDVEKCTNCGLCVDVCPIEVDDEYNARLKKRKAIYANSPPVWPLSHTIDSSMCEFYDCAKCVEVCPTNAIVLDQKDETLTLSVGSIVLATGFEEYDPRVIKEYHYGDYPDVITNLELARMIDGFGPTSGAIVRPSNRKPAKNIVMIQCVGSRDRRWKEYCSSICCMISLKHASLIKSSYPDSDITICYIDIRTTGREHEYYYEKAREMGVKFVKGRPTEILEDPESGKLIVDVEDITENRFLQLDSDLVVLAPAMVPASDTKNLAEILDIELESDGFYKEYNAKLRPTETKKRGIFICGGATFPKDAPSTSLQAHSASLKATKFLNSGKIIKDQRTAFVNDEYCGDCEFCPVTCPYGAIELVENEEGHEVARISDLLCEGCGICVGTCPLGAIELRHSTPDQMSAQINALMSINGTVKPLILSICCSECGHTVVDSSGMAMMEYPANVRVMKVPCTGILQIQQFLEAFKAGAQGVMVVGCKDDGCHYEEGARKAKRKVELAKILLKEYGVEPDRLEMFNMVYIEGKQFAEAARRMTEKLQNMGELQMFSQ